MTTLTVGNTTLDTTKMNAVETFITSLVAKKVTKEKEIVEVITTPPGHKSASEEWEATGYPSEFWLLWGLGKVWWTPTTLDRPFWAEILRGQWDHAWS